MSLATSWRKWWRRHRWLISYGPEADDTASYMRDPAHDPMRYEWNAQQGYQTYGRLGDEGYREDEIDT